MRAGPSARRSWPARALRRRGAAIVAAWLDSPPHRAIILSSTWRDAGIGVLYAPSAPGTFGDAQAIVVTADFGLRIGRAELVRSAAIAPSRGRERAYAASVWIGVACGSISVAKPRSQEMITRPSSSIPSTMPRSPAHRPRVVARSLDELDPRSDRHTGPKPGSEKPCALSIHTGAYRFRRAKALPSEVTFMLQESNSSPKKLRGPADRSELDGLGSIRRHHPARRANGMTSTDSTPDDERRGGLVRRVLSAPGRIPRSGSRSSSPSGGASSMRTRSSSTRPSRSSSVAKSSCATHAPRSSGCFASVRPTSRRARRSSPSTSRELTRRERELADAEEDLGAAAAGARRRRAQASRGRAARTRRRDTRGRARRARGAARHASSGRRSPSSSHSCRASATPSWSSTRPRSRQGSSSRSRTTSSS